MPVARTMRRIREPVWFRFVWFAALALALGLSPWLAGYAASAAWRAFLSGWNA